jgi:hypothetical protein
VANPDPRASGVGRLSSSGSRFQPSHAMSVVGHIATLRRSGTLVETIVFADADFFTLAV